MFVCAYVCVILLKRIVTPFNVKQNVAVVFSAGCGINDSAADINSTYCIVLY